MPSFTPKNYPILLLLLLLHVRPPVSSGNGPAHPPSDTLGDPDLLFMKYHIHIVNNMPSDVSTLLVHCKSKTDDLGLTLLPPLAEYLIRSKVDFFRRKLYFCFVRWGSKQRYFDGFKASRDEFRCMTGNCYWSVRPEGFFFSEDKVTWHREYQWPSPQ